MAVTYTTKSIVVDGLKTAWLEAGSDTGPILLFLHGFPDAAECWEYQIDYFSKSYQVVAPYGRGVSPSDNGESQQNYDPRTIARDLLQILEQVDPIGDRPIFCVGHDLGSVPAWYLGGLLQQRLAGLVIINGLTISQMVKRFRNPRQLLKSWYMAFMQIPLVPEVTFRGAGAWLAQRAYNVAGLKDQARPLRHGFSGASKDSFKQYRAFFAAVPWALNKTPERLKAPVLILWGEKDAFLEPTSQSEMKKVAENVTIRILRGNHWVHRERPQEVNKLIDNFLKLKLEEYLGSGLETIPEAAVVPMEDLKYNSENDSDIN